MADRMRSGFLRNAVGALVVTALMEGARMRSGFLVDDSGRLIVVGPEGEPVGISKNEVEELFEELSEGASEATVEAVMKKSGMALFNVKKNGAKGDGVTDDHTAIQATFEECATAGKGTVYFPPCAGANYYKTSSNFTYVASKAIHVLGHFEAGEIRMSADLAFGKCMFEVSVENESSGAIHHYFSNLSIKGVANYPHSPKNRTTIGYTPSDAMGFQCISNVRMVNCVANGFYAGFLIQGNHQILTDCEGRSCFIGRYFGAPRPGDENRGNQRFINWEATGSFWAGTVVHPDNMINGCVLDYDGGGRSPYVLYKEGPMGQNQFYGENWAVWMQTEYHGNAFAFDEGAAASLPAALKPGYNPFGGEWEELPLSTLAGNTAGNVQIIAITATGGTFKIVIPAGGGGEGGAGGTTAAINWNATDTEIETAIQAKLSGGAIATVTTSGGKRQILLSGNISLRGSKEMTLEVGALTGGSATLTAPSVDPNMGPRVRPMTPQKIVVSGATGGTYTITVKVEGVEKTTAAIKWNATYVEVIKAIRGLANVTTWGACMVPTSGPYYVFFNGSLFGKTVTMTVNGAALTGGAPEVKVEEGPETNMPLRHEEFTFDIGKFGNVEIGGSDPVWAIGEKGVFRSVEFGGAGVRQNIRGAPAGAIIGDAAIKAGTKVVASGGGFGGACRFETSTGTFALRTVTGPVVRGNLLATSGANCVIYPAEANKGALARPHCGYAGAAIAGAEAVKIPVLIDATNVGFSVPYDAAGVPATNKYLKPSTTTAGQVTTATEAADHIVGATLAGGSAGNVTTAPLGCA